MPAGVPSAQIVELELTAGVWTAITGDVTSDGVTLYRGRPDETSVVQPANCSWKVENVPDVNGTCNYTPDNPLSTYFPNLTEGKRVRVQVKSPSLVGYYRFIGWIDSITPAWSDEPNKGTVAFTASDALAQYGRQTLKSDYAHQVIIDNASSDLFRFGQTTDTRTLENTINTSGTGTIIDPGFGSAMFAQDSALNLDGVLNLTAIDSGAANLNTAGRMKSPVFQLPAGGQPKSIEFFFKTNVAPTGGAESTLYSMLYQDIDDLFYLWGAVGATTLVVGFTSAVGGSFVDTVQANDGVWHHVAMKQNSGTLYGCYVDDRFIGNTTYASAASVIPRFFGGRAVTGSVQGSCCPAISYAGLAINYSSTNTHRVYALPNQTVAAQSRYFELASYSDIAATASALVVGSDNRLVIRTPTAGRYLLDAMIELATSVGGNLYTDNNGLVTLTMSDSARPKTPAATITLESDDEATAGLVWKRAVDSIPTRVAVSSPLGSVTVVNSAAEAAGAPPRQVSITTCCATVGDAADVGYAALTASPRLRPAQISVDLVTATTDMYAAFMANALIGERIRIAGLPTGVFGFSYVDVYVQGYGEVMPVLGEVITFNTTPADAPPDARFDDTTYGRFASDGATVTGGTCVGNTNTGTLIVATTNGSSPTWSTSAGDYPMDLDWNGERITVSGVGGGTSPQTLTVTARGVAPSVARVHPTGEAIDVYEAACFAF